MRKKSLIENIARLIAEQPDKHMPMSQWIIGIGNDQRNDTAGWGSVASFEHNDNEATLAVFHHFRELGMIPRAKTQGKSPKYLYLSRVDGNTIYAW